MSGTKEIRNQIKSIGSTRKITKAMEMVAASKMRRAQNRMNAARPYANKMRVVVSHLANAHPEYMHPYVFRREEVKAVGFIVISSDRGLCGGLNVNVFRKAANAMAQWQDDGVQIRVCIIGKKAGAFFKRYNAEVISEVSGLGDAPELNMLIGATKALMDSYLDYHVDRVFVISNEFVNTMTQSPRVEQLIPIVPSEEPELKHYWDYIYEPDSKEVIDFLMSRYVESLVYQSVAENSACEQAARMVAMKAATDNAGNLIDDLQLVYNKARQAAITQELSEIVGGAAAV